MPTVYTYLRAHLTPSRTDPDLDDQRREARRVFQADFQPHGCTLGKEFVDQADTVTTPLFERPAGHALLKCLQPGDLALIPQFAKGFKDVDDLFRVVEIFRQLECGLLVMDINLASTGDTSKTVLGILRCLRQARSQLQAERARRALARRVTPATNQYAGYGFRWVGRHGRLCRRVDSAERAVMSRIVELRQAGRSWEQIALTLLRDRVVATTGREWSISRVRRGYQAEMALRAQEVPGNKRCATCGQVKPATNSYFNTNSTQPDRLCPDCKECLNPKRRPARVEAKAALRQAKARRSAEFLKRRSTKAKLAAEKILTRLGGPDEFAREFLATLRGSQKNGIERLRLLASVMYGTGQRLFR